MYWKRDDKHEKKDRIVGLHGNRGVMKWILLIKPAKIKYEKLLLFADDIIINLDNLTFH